MDAVRRLGMRVQCAGPDDVAKSFILGDLVTDRDRSGPKRVGVGADEARPQNEAVAGWIAAGDAERKGVGLRSEGCGEHPERRGAKRDHGAQHGAAMPGRGLHRAALSAAFDSNATATPDECGYCPDIVMPTD